MPSRPVSPPVATVPGRPASRQVFGDVVRVIQGGQSEFLHTSPRTLAPVNKTPLYVDLLVKHGRHSLRGREMWQIHSSGCECGAFPVHSKITVALYNAKDAASDAMSAGLHDDNGFELEECDEEEKSHVSLPWGPLCVFVVDIKQCYNT